jgi:hypothetical protein
LFQIFKLNELILFLSFGILWWLSFKTFTG